MTIYDIASKAGVSITTVSRVLNGKSNVNERTRAQVQRVLSESGYMPSQVARGLANKSTKTIGVMAVDIRDVHHAAAAFEVEQALSRRGYSSIVCNLGSLQKRFLHSIDMLVNQQVEGIILIGSVFEKSLCQEECEHRLAETPVVIANGMVDRPNVYGVLVDETSGAAQAVDLFVQNGCRNIALVCDDMTRSERCKRQGYEESMRRNGLVPMRSIESLRTFEAGYEATIKLMADFPDTDAILYTEDITAAGGIRALRDLGLSVPEQVKIIGFNNSFYTRLCYPTLTSVDNQLAAMGAAAAKLLVDVIEKRPCERTVYLDCNLAVREST